ncbi:hypothetical protein [Metallosphaera cuprina]|uniref:Uncharacterized protein n=1 Tax=Metallosphaera cuprina (strain Ar-4) TaxID=1006006 RepID=F4G2V4_METCR|nr:hypothetical protein [Metallosphaera cuprina]AEB95152.1 hypothetical protein Mcup_1047 [Metallosphaera cuprina Ar-4]
MVDCKKIKLVSKSPFVLTSIQSFPPAGLGFSFTSLEYQDVCFLGETFSFRLHKFNRSLLKL